MKINFSKTTKEVNTNIIFIFTNELNEILKQDNTIIIVDAVVINNYKDIFNDLEDKTIIIDEKYLHKDFVTFRYLCEELIKKNVGKDAHLYGIGGGTITDLTGFIASVYLRGIKVSFIPTTLLSMIDAAIGGKNAINIENIKNAIGSIYQPANIYINTSFLMTQSQSAIIEGFAEAIKIGLLFDIQLMNDCILYLDKINIYNDDIDNNIDNDNIQRLNSIIIKSTKHKINIITEDEKDKNNRLFLNFGHTIGNLLEIEYGLTHGNAISIGMIYESQIAVLLNLIDISIFNEIYRIITKYFEYDIKKFDIIKSVKKLMLDKKIIGNRIKIPIITEIGRAKLVEVKLDDFINCINMNFNLIPH